MGKVIHVAKDATGAQDGTSWENALTTITTGLAASSMDDEIWVKAATYGESISMKARVALFGGFAGTETGRNQRDWIINPTIIDATGLNLRTVKMNWAREATLDGFTITGGTAIDTFNDPYGGGIYCSGIQSATISNCIIDNNLLRMTEGECTVKMPHRRLLTAALPVIHQQ